ncbi:MAG: carboxypeptidase-like regulatory domain-containing protein [Muribaculaceae bacterium]|nr:carboxypeptidase-like regulatory domain-containing protein [Muribaculaceae bacterium]MDE6027735.1 carboxypeptidase-like regulatory domain-containing protein [Muribaculaceae bacterium]
MKNFFVILLLFISSVSLFGQSYNNGQVTTKIITGIVVDKGGEPVAGAYVNATNGPETVETAQDGSYSIEVPVWLKSLTASYYGLGAVAVPLKDTSEVKFRLTEKLPVLKKKVKKMFDSQK